MAKKLNEIMQKLPRARQEKIEARAAELIAEHMTLRDVNTPAVHARGLSASNLSGLVDPTQYFVYYVNGKRLSSYLRMLSPVCSSRNQGLNRLRGLSQCL